MASAPKEDSDDTKQPDADDTSPETPAKESSKDAYQMDAIKQLDQDVQETTELMRGNVEAVVERGENLEELDERAENIEEHAKEFKKTSSKVKHMYCFKSLRMTLCIVGIVALVVAVIVVVIVLVVVKPWESGDDPANNPALTSPASTQPTTESTAAAI